MTRPLRVGVIHPPVSFDMEQPVGFTNDTTADLSQSIYDQLTAPRAYLTDRGTRRVDWHTMQPVLAESWSFEDRSWTFRLRPGVISHAGREMTAEDVKWGWHRAFALRDVGKWVARVSSVPDEDAIVVVDRYTIRFDLSSRNPALPRTLAQCTPAVYDTAEVMAHATADDPWARQFLTAHDAGFGPYRLDHFSASEIVLTAHDRYWGGAPAITEVRVQVFPSIDAATDALRAGEIDLVPGIPMLQAMAIGDPIRLAWCDSTPGLALHIDPSESPFEDIRVRQAIAHAVPCDDILQSAYFGLARRWRSWVGIDAPGYANEWPYPEDVDRARHLLAEAGHPGGVQTRLAVRAGDGTDRTVPILEAALARIGVSISVESAQRTPPGTKANPAPLFLHGQSSPGRGVRVFDPLYSLHHDFGPGRMRLFRYVFESQTMYAAMAEAADAGDTPAWHDATRRAQAALNTDAVVVPICAYPSVVAHHRDLEGYRWYPDNTVAFAGLRWRD